MAQGSDWMKILLTCATTGRGKDAVLYMVVFTTTCHPIFRNIYFSENLRKKSIILKPRVNLLGLFFV